MVNKKTSSKTSDNKKENKVVKKKVKCELSMENISLFHEGKHYEAYAFMGSHVVNEKERGVRFTTWAPKAQNVICGR